MQEANKNAPSTAMDAAHTKINVDMIVPLICVHCDIVIDWAYDTDYQVEVDGEDVTICEGCYNDYLCYGGDFGDAHYKKLLGGCPHKDWAVAELASRKVVQTA